MNKCKLFPLLSLIIVILFYTGIESEATIVKRVELDSWGTTSVMYNAVDASIIIFDGKLSKQDLANENKPWVRAEKELDYIPTLMRNVSNIEFRNVEVENGDLSYLFYDAEGIKSVDMSGLKISDGPNAYICLDSMFENCKSLKTIKISDQMGTHTVSAKKMFKNATSLSFIDMNIFDSRKLKYADEMFSGAISLKRIQNDPNVPEFATELNGYSSNNSFDLSKLKSATYMFKDTVSLEHIDLKDTKFKTNSKVYTGIFEGSGLQSFTTVAFHNSYIELDPSMFLLWGAWFNPELGDSYGRHRTTNNLIRDIDKDIEYSLNKNNTQPNYTLRTELTYQRGIWYGVNYHANDGTNKEIPDTVHSRFNKEDFNLNNGSDLEQYEKFTSWNTKKDGSGVSFKPGQKVRDLSYLNGDTVHLFAQYNNDPYTVKYDANIEGATGTMQDKTVESDKEFVIEDSKYSKEGYKFSHWTTTKEANSDPKLYPGQQVTNLAEPGKTVTLYAQWTPIKYEVVYNDTMDDVSSLYKEVLPPYYQEMTYDVEEKLMPVQFDKKGYTHLAWKDAMTDPLNRYGDGAVVKNLAKNEGDLVRLFTEWRAHHYRIAFHPNGGTGSMESIKCIYDESTKLPKETFTRKNYIFLGWSTDPTSKDPEFGSEDLIQNLTDKDLAEVTLYAIWQIDRYLD